MYFKRYIDKVIEHKMKLAYAVNVVGPKFCGKTTSCDLLDNSKIKLISEDIILLVQANPSLAIDGEKPRLIDEWQEVPILWDKIRGEADSTQGVFGQYILTGSSTPADQTSIYHTGSGRIITVKMKPLSLYESLESKGKVSLRELFDNPSFSYVDLNEGYDIKDTLFYMARGGWPNSIFIKNRKDAIEATWEYYNSLFNFETSDNKRFRNKKPELVKMLIRSYARNISTEASDATLISDVIGENNRTFSKQTFYEYEEVIKDLFIVENLEAWNPSIRSKATVRSLPVRHFVDTSVALAALKITPEMLLKDVKSLGLFFEDFVIRDLSIYAMVNNGYVNHYRDSDGLECDAIVHLNDGRYGLIEIKLGGEKLINEGIKTLNKLEKKLDTDKYGYPSFKMIIVASGYAYKTEEGVHIVPINLLKD